MYPIQSMRLVNMRIPDEEKDVLMKDDFYDLHSENALLTLANGGGKSSLVLLFSQVFKPNARRGNRQLKDYVQDEGHSVILVEVNRGTQFATLGLVARKKFFGESDEQQREELDYFLFISEYSQKQRELHGPKQFPLFKDLQQKQFKSYEELEAYIKEHQELFQYYKRTNRSKYMKYLETQFPNVAAWADTIWEINAVEGGASGKFAINHKEPDILIPTHQVIKDHLIPIIESKHQIDQEKFQEQLTSVGRKYASQFQSEHRRDVLTTFQSNIQTMFLDKTQEVHQLTKVLNEATTEFKTLLGQLLPYATYQEQQVKKFQQEYASVEELLAKTRLAKSYVILTEKVELLNELKQQFEQVQVELSETESEQQRLEELVKVMKATRYYQVYLSDKQALSLAEHREQVARSANREKDRELTELRATIAKVSQTLYDDLVAQVESVKCELEATKNEQRTLNEEKQKTERLLYREEAQMKQATKEVKRLKQEVSVRWDQLKTATQDIVGNRETWERERDELLISKDYEIGKLEEEETNERIQIDLKEDLQKQVNAQRLVVEQREKDYDQLKKKRAMLLEDFSKEAPYEQVELFDDREISVIYHETANDFERRKKAIQKDIELIDQALSLKREVVIPTVVEQWLHEEGIEYLQGVHYLNELNSEEERQQFLVDYPMLPYSLVLKKPHDLEKIRQYRGEMTESGLLLFMTDPHHYLGTPTSNWWGLGYYPQEFLDVELWQQRCETLEEKRQSFETRLNEIEKKIRDFATLFARLEECSVARIKRTEGMLEEEQLKEDQLTSQLQLQQAICLEAKQVVTTQRNKCEALDEDLKTLEARLLELDKIESLTQEMKTTQQGIEAGRKKQETYESKLQSIQVQLQRIAGNEERLNNQRVQLAKPLGEAETLAKDYQRFANESLVLEQYLNTAPTELVQHVEALEREIDLSSLLAEIERLTQQCERSFSDFEEYGVSMEVCETTTYDKLLVKQYEAQLEELKTSILNQNKEVASLKATIELKQEEVDDLDEDFKIAQEKYIASYGETELTLDHSLHELKEQERFHKLRLGELKNSLNEAIDFEKDLSRAVKNHRKGTAVFPLDQLKPMGATIHFEVMSVEEYLKELDQAETNYRDQASRLKESLYRWNRAYQQLWMIDEEVRQVLPTGVTKFYTKYPEMKAETYLAIVEGMEKNIGTLQAVIDLENQRLSEADREREIFVEYIAAQCHEVYDQLKVFDKGLTIQLDGKNQSILDLDVPLLVESNQFEEAIETYLKQYIQDVAILMNKVQEADELNKLEHERSLTQKISRFKLATVLTQVVDFEKAKLRVLKVTHLGFYLTAWEGDSSGGQGSLKALILIFTIFKYLNNSKVGTSILLDNPFGKMSSHQLVGTMFKVAQKLNIQLICLTGISETHIQDRFDVHYHLRHTETKTGKGFLEVKLVRGESVEMEQATHRRTARPTREELTQKVSEQLSLMDLAD